MPQFEVATLQPSPYTLCSLLAIRLSVSATSSRASRGVLEQVRRGPSPTPLAAASAVAHVPLLCVHLIQRCTWRFAVLQNAVLASLADFLQLAAPDEGGERADHRSERWTCMSAAQGLF
eukprot:5944175-Pleurochrysis_carterae.AAC.4